MKSTRCIIFKWICMCFFKNKRRLIFLHLRISLMNVWKKFNRHLSSLLQRLTALVAIWTFEAAALSSSCTESQSLYLFSVNASVSKYFLATIIPHCFGINTFCLAEISIKSACHVGLDCRDMLLEQCCQIQLDKKNLDAQRDTVKSTLLLVDGHYHRNWSSTYFRHFLNDIIHSETF